MDDSGGALSGLLAEEDSLDRRALWRIGSWGVGAVAAVTIAVMANQTSLGWRRDQTAAADLTRQAQQAQLVARESQNEARRLASAVDTLNGDRDRLYSRVTTLEQGLDSVTGTIARQKPSAAAPPGATVPSPAAEPPSAAQSATPAPSVAPVATTQTAPAKPEKSAAADKPLAATAETGPATVSTVAKDSAKTDAAKSDAAKSDTTKADTGKADTAAKPVTEKPAAATPATPLMASKSIMAPPDPAAGKLIEPTPPASAVTTEPIAEVVATAPAATDEEADEATAPKVAIQRTEFGVDLGTANSVDGLRALWRGLLKSKSNAPLAALRPIIVVKESPRGSGMQLRLVAGPLNDAGAAAKICAVLTENRRACDTAIFDGQRLSVKTDDPAPAAIKPQPRLRAAPKHAAAVVAEEPAKKPDASTAMSSWFGKKGQ
jgi:hypothetical protein